jgi:hypothetical protein
MGELVVSKNSITVKCECGARHEVTKDGEEFCLESTYKKPEKKIIPELTDEEKKEKEANDKKGKTIFDHFK